MRRVARDLGSTVAARRDRLAPEAHFPLLRAWVSAEAAAVLAAADELGSRRTLLAAVAARGEVVSLRGLAMGPSMRRRESPLGDTMTPTRPSRNIEGPILETNTTIPFWDHSLDVASRLRHNHARDHQGCTPEVLGDAWAR